MHDQIDHRIPTNRFAITQKGQRTTGTRHDTLPDELSMVHAYSYRNPRLSTSMPVEFATDGGVLLGMTRDISENGLLVEFIEPIFRNIRGKVRFRTGHCLLELGAQVAHTEGFTAGLTFLYSSERESAFVRSLLQVLSKAPEQLSGPGV